VAEANKAAIRLPEKLMKTMQWEGRIISVGASIGIVIYPLDGKDFDSLITCAGARMYKARFLGKATICSTDTDQSTC